MPAVPIMSREQYIKALEVLDRVGGTFQGVGIEEKRLLVSEAQYRALVEARVVIPDQTRTDKRRPRTRPKPAVRTGGRSMEAPLQDNPVAVGLMLCDQVIVDKDTNKPCLIGIFTGLAVQDFHEAQRFSAFVALTNGRGQVNVELVGLRLDNGEQIYKQTYSVLFPDPLKVVNLNIRVRSIVFPAPGWYDFVIRVRGEPVSQRRIHVYPLAGPK
jgi:hypothetical protein